MGISRFRLTPSGHLGGISPSRSPAALLAALQERICLGERSFHVLKCRFGLMIRIALDKRSLGHP